MIAQSHFIRRAGTRARFARVVLIPLFPLIPLIALVAGLFAEQAMATPGIKVLSEVAYDGPIKYTVKMSSKTWGNAEETRTIRSGQTDDFTWQSVPPGGAVNVADACPNVDAIRNASGTTVRQVKIRFAAVVSTRGDADVQLSFQGHTPKAATAVMIGGKKVQCPADNAFSQMTHFSMPTGGTAKTVTLSDGTQLAVTASRK